MELLIDARRLTCAWSWRALSF